MEPNFVLRSPTPPHLEVTILNSFAPPIPSPKKNKLDVYILITLSLSTSTIGIARVVSRSQMSQNHFTLDD